MTLRTSLLALLAVLIASRAAYPCSIVNLWPPPAASKAEFLLALSDVIVRVVAEDYARSPASPDVRTTGEPDSRVRFRILEILKGVEPAREVVLPGYLVDVDDFNDRPAPYDFVRPNGRSGSCFANAYRRNGQFLLMLKKLEAGGYTVDWDALSPVNEQLRSENDDWLVWVRRQLARNQLEAPDLDAARRKATYEIYSQVIRSIAAGKVSLLRGQFKDPVVIYDRTVLPAGDGLAIQAAAISAEHEADFRQTSQLSQPLVREFDIGQPYTFVPLARSREANLAFSAVGFARDFSRAVVYVHVVAPEWGNGIYVTMTRRNGWTIERVLPVWSFPQRVVTASADRQAPEGR